MTEAKAMIKYYGRVECLRTVNIEQEGPFDDLETARNWAKKRRAQIVRGDTTGGTELDPSSIRASVIRDIEIPALLRAEGGAG